MVLTPVTRHAGLAPAKTQLPNGMAVVVKETRKTPIVSLNIAVRAGAACDPAGCGGAANLLARVIDRGTALRSAADIAEAFDSRGVSLTVNLSRHLMTFVCTCLAADFEAILAAVADVIRNPAIPGAELATRKGEVATAITQDADNPFFRATEALMAALYGADHPYGRPPKGSLESVERISREELLEFHRRWFAPGAVTAVIVGDVSAESAHAAVARAFGDWDASAAAPVAVAAPSPISRRTQTVVPIMGKSQADVAYGFVALARSDSRYYAYWLANHVIGQYAVGGRLGDSIRERQGMAYYAGTVFEANIAPGPLFVRAGVSPANVDRAIASIDEELARARDGGLTQEELDNSRNYLIGSMPRALETNHGIANFLQTNETFGLGLDYDIRMPGLLQDVTLEAANAAVREVFDPRRATIAIAGPYEDK
jgi:zinc protease